MIWFCYGFFTALMIILLGILGWGATMMLRILSYAPLGLMIVFGIMLVVVIVKGFFIAKK